VAVTTASPPGRPITAELVTAALRYTLRAYVPNLVKVTMLGPGADQLVARVVLDLGGHCADGAADHGHAVSGRLYGQVSHLHV
jgi:hypothetical protein